MEETQKSEVPTAPPPDGSAPHRLEPSVSMTNIDIIFKHIGTNADDIIEFSKKLRLLNHALHDYIDTCESVYLVSVLMKAANPSVVSDSVPSASTNVDVPPFDEIEPGKVYKKINLKENIDLARYFAFNDAGRRFVQKYKNQYNNEYFNRKPIDILTALAGAIELTQCVCRVEPGADSNISDEDAEILLRIETLQRFFYELPLPQKWFPSRPTPATFPKGTIAVSNIEWFGNDKKSYDGFNHEMLRAKLQGPEFEVLRYKVMTEKLKRPNHGSTTNTSTSSSSYGK